MSVPQTPAAVLARVLRIARFDGWSIAIVSGLSLLGVVFSLNPVTLIVAATVFAASLHELSGARQLKAGNIAGVNALVRSQVIILGAILAYCAVRIASYSPELLDESLSRAQAMGYEIPISRAELEPMVHKFYNITYSIVAAVTVCYQGGLAIYYHRRRLILAQALAAQPPVLPPV